MSCMTEPVREVDFPTSDVDLASTSETSSSRPVEDPQVARQDQLDKLFTAASVLAQLRAGEKIRCIGRDPIDIEIQPVYAFVPMRLIRLLTKQNVDVTHSCVKAIYEAFWQQMDQCLAVYDTMEVRQRASPNDIRLLKELQDVRFHEFQLINRLDREVRTTISGTRSLTSTYRDDTKFSGTVNVLIQNVSAKLLDYERRISNTFGRTNVRNIRHHSPALTFLPRDLATSPIDIPGSSFPGQEMTVHVEPTESSDE